MGIDDGIERAKVFLGAALEQTLYLFPDGQVHVTLFGVGVANEKARLVGMEFEDVLGEGS